MIRESDLLEAIAECQGERNPNANTCRNLAAYYTILDHITQREKPEEQIKGYSYSDGSIGYSSNSNFGMAIKKKNIDDVMPLIDELMTTLEVVYPRLYDAVMMKLKEG